MDRLKDKLKSAAIVLAAVEGGKVQLAAGVTADRIGTIKAGELVNFVAQQVGGKGGGKADMAMAGGTDPSKLPRRWIRCAPGWPSGPEGAAPQRSRLYRARAFGSRVLLSAARAQPQRVAADAGSGAASRLRMAAQWSSLRRDTPPLATRRQAGRARLRRTSPRGCRPAAMPDRCRCSGTPRSRDACCAPASSSTFEPAAAPAARPVGHRLAIALVAGDLDAHHARLLRRRQQLAVAVAHRLGDGLAGSRRRGVERHVGHRRTVRRCAAGCRPIPARRRAPRSSPPRHRLSQGQPFQCRRRAPRLAGIARQRSRVMRQLGHFQHHRRQAPLGRRAAAPRRPPGAADRAGRVARRRSAAAGARPPQATQPRPAPSPRRRRQ